MPYRDYQQHLAQCRKYYAEHKEDARLRKDPHRHKENNRRYLLKKKYGISADEYQQMFEEQHGRCAICGKHQSEFYVALCVDHNHETGKIRGLLCNRCNQAIGLLDDDIQRFKVAVLYLEGEK